MVEIEEGEEEKCENCECCCHGLGNEEVVAVMLVGLDREGGVVIGCGGVCCVGVGFGIELGLGFEAEDVDGILEGGNCCGSGCDCGGGGCWGGSDTGEEAAGVWVEGVELVF